MEARRRTLERMLKVQCNLIPRDQKSSATRRTWTIDPMRIAYYPNKTIVPWRNIK
jgi:hypothetical protein